MIFSLQYKEKLKVSHFDAIIHSKIYRFRNNKINSINQKGSTLDMEEIFVNWTRGWQPFGNRVPKLGF